MKKVAFVAVGVALSLVAARGVFAESVPAAAPADAQAAAVAASHPQALVDRVLGKADAPVTLIEYASLTCSHCADFHVQVLPQLKKEYIDTGKVKLIFRDFPFDEAGLKASMIARCLPSEKYFDFLGSLYQTQASWSRASDDKILRQMASFAGMNDGAFNACVEDKALQDHLLEVRVNATNNDKVNSTPTMFVEGTLERVVGAQDYDAYKAVIDRQLEKVGAPK